jgi:hypothetical protein
MFTIENPDLKKIDAEIVELNKKYGLILHSLNNFPNTLAAKKIISELEKIEEKISKIKTKKEFDSLIKENHLENIKAQKAYMLYFSTGKIKIDKLIEIVLGKDAMKIVMDKIKKFSYSAYWDYYLAYQEYSYKSIPYDDEVLREQFKKILTELKSDLLEYAEIHYNLPKDYQFDLILGPPYLRNSSFHPTTKRMEISPSTFFAFKENGEVKINVCFVIEVLFHELLGHGRQEFNSRILPAGLQDNAINTAVPTSHIHAEGVAKLSAKESINFMKQYKEKYKIEEDYITQRELSFASETSDFWNFYQYLKLKGIENKKFDIEKEFMKKTSNYGAFLLYANSGDTPLSFIKNTCYSVGAFYLKEIIKDLEKEMGKDFKKNKSLINQAISTGVWNYKVLPKFIRFFLKSV